MVTEVEKIIYFSQLLKALYSVYGSNHFLFFFFFLFLVFPLFMNDKKNAFLNENLNNVHDLTKWSLRCGIFVQIKNKEWASLLTDFFQWLNLLWF